MSTTTTTVMAQPSIKDALINEVPVTLKHPPPTDLDRVIPNPGMPRANKAISREKPDGTPNSPPNASALQQHVLWFDFDSDGVIYPWDTFIGFHRLGFNFILSFVALLVIHGTFSMPTWHSWFWPSNLLLPIYLDRMHRTKHGSDSEVYDTEGRFVPQKFEEIFSKYDSGNKGGLSWSDIQEMVYGNMNVNDPVGWIAERLEWWTTWWLAKDEAGILRKEAIRANYDGSLWEVIASQVAEKRKHPSFNLAQATGMNTAVPLAAQAIKKVT